MHIYVAGIGGSGMGPLAQIALDLGYSVSGSDLVESETITNFRKQGVTVNVGQTKDQIAKLDEQHPIDWYVYSSALTRQVPNHPELAYVAAKGIKAGKRDQFLTEIISKHNFKLLAITGTHGKTTTTAMSIWLLSQLGLDISYSLGGQFHDMPAARASTSSQWFVYEADEYDRNFLAYQPAISLITGLGHDHHEIYPTLASYNQAFVDFINQSEQVLIWQQDLAKLTAQDLKLEPQVLVEPDSALTLAGRVNRLDAELAAQAAHLITGKPLLELYEILNHFPGVKRRFEALADNLYTDYAHTPEKIAGCLEIAQQTGKPIVVVYEPHSNHRQHQIKEQYLHLFDGVKKIYWLPSFSAREKADLAVLTPADLIGYLNKPEVAEVAEINQQLKDNINHHRQQADTVVAMSAGSLDGWLRTNFCS